MENVVAYKKETFPVGKWIPDSKVKYRWCLKINDNPYIVTFINSKISRMVRVLVNEKAIFTEKKDKSTPFHFKLSIEDLNLVLKKHPLNNDFDLFIEDQDYEYLSRCTTRNCPPDLFVEANKNLCRDFTISQKDDCFQIARSHYTMSDPSEANDFTALRHRPLNYMVVSDNTVYSEGLNDSGHLFKTEYFFLNIADVNEEKALVKRVNNFA